MGATGRQVAPLGSGHQLTQEPQQPGVAGTSARAPRRLREVREAAQIAVGISQKELAARLGLKEQQIQRYEATDYASASLARVNAVIRALGLTVREEIRLPECRGGQSEEERL